MFWSIAAIFLGFILLLILYLRTGKKNRVCVLVLGDVGRSPRMQNHALSCAMAGYAVDLVGFGGSSPLKEILKHDKIKLIRIGDFPGFLTYLPRLLYYAVKAVFQSVQLFVILFSSAINCSHILVQNPPAIPSLAVAWLVSLLCNCKLLIDWHNFGYTILALGVGTPDHLLVRIAKWYEQCFGKMASGNFCVTEAMREDLQNNWCITASTLYDRPPERFKPTDVMSQHKLFMKLSSDYPVFGQTKSLPEFAEKVVEEVSAMTVKTNKGSIHQREDRPALIVSSTSWTEDEDFSVLLDALEGYERSVEKEKGLPNLLCAITGKGPQKDYYKQLISEKNLKHVSICTPWLDPEDYPKLLGSADFGVCLHKSSSGLDLPMKVVDMFGSGLPVCAIHFNCLHELVKHNENGLVFKDSKQLTQQIEELLKNFPVKNTKLQEFRQNLKEFQQIRWEETWNQVVLPVIRR